MYQLKENDNDSDEWKEVKNETLKLVLKSCKINQIEKIEKLGIVDTETYWKDLCEKQNHPKQEGESWKCTYEQLNQDYEKKIEKAKAKFKKAEKIVKIGYEKKSTNFFQNDKSETKRNLTGKNLSGKNLTGNNLTGKKRKRNTSNPPTKKQINNKKKSGKSLWDKVTSQAKQDQSSKRRRTNDL